jgi:hypothetical protein
VRIYFFGSRVRERAADVRCMYQLELAKTQYLPPHLLDQCFYPFKFLLVYLSRYARSYSGIAFACRKYPLLINQHMAIAGWDVCRAMASLIR